jgi:DNA/RNA-binding domain of Phe-tRNA-synthetase-like protein
MKKEAPLKPIIEVDDRRLEEICRLGTVIVNNVRADAVQGGEGADSHEVDRIRAEAVAGIRSEYGGQEPGSIERVGEVRAMYRALNLDPHHTRPSSEALLRRVLRGGDLPRVNAVVDTANAWSLRNLCPVGLYDADHIKGSIRFVVCAEGEGYEGIGKPWINLGGRPALRDEAGPFGNPSSDSARTAITERTRRVLAVTFAPPSFPPGEVLSLYVALRACAEG